MKNILSIRLDTIIKHLIKKDFSDEQLEELLSSFDLLSLNLIIKYFVENYDLNSDDINTKVANNIIDVITLKIADFHSNIYEFFNQFNDLDFDLADSFLNTLIENNLNIEEIMDLILDKNINKSEVMYIIDTLLSNGFLELCIDFSTADEYLNFNIAQNFISYVDQTDQSINISDFTSMDLHIINDSLSRILDNSPENSLYYEILNESIINSTIDEDTTNSNPYLDFYYFQKNTIINNYDKIRILK